MTACLASPLPWMFSFEKSYRTWDFFHSGVSMDFRRWSELDARRKFGWSIVCVSFLSEPKWRRTIAPSSGTKRRTNASMDPCGTDSSHPTKVSIRMILHPWLRPTHLNRKPSPERRDGEHTRIHSGASGSSLGKSVSSPLYAPYFVYTCIYTQQKHIIKKLLLTKGKEQGRQRTSWLLSRKGSIQEGRIMQDVNDGEYPFQWR
jgi:hypothetical protein